MCKSAASFSTAADGDYYYCGLPCELGCASPASAASVVMECVVSSSQPLTTTKTPTIIIINFFQEPGEEDELLGCISSTLCNTDLHQIYCCSGDFNEAFFQMILPDTFDLRRRPTESFTNLTCTFLSLLEPSHRRLNWKVIQSTLTVSSSPLHLNIIRSRFSLYSYHLSQTTRPQWSVLTIFVLWLQSHFKPFFGYFRAIFAIFCVN